MSDGSCETGMKLDARNNGLNGMKQILDVGIEAWCSYNVCINIRLNGACVLCHTYCLLLSFISCALSIECRVSSKYDSFLSLSLFFPFARHYCRLGITHLLYLASKNDMRSLKIVNTNDQVHWWWFSWVWIVVVVAMSIKFQVENRQWRKMQTWRLKCARQNPTWRKNPRKIENFQTLKKIH